MRIKLNEREQTKVGKEREEEEKTTRDFEDNAGIVHLAEVLSAGTSLITPRPIVIIPWQIMSRLPKMGSVEKTITFASPLPLRHP